jgi:hypothetical protein
MVFKKPNIYIIDVAWMRRSVMRCRNTNQTLLRKAASDRGRIISYNPFTHSYMVKFRRLAGIFSVHENWIDETVAFRNSILAMKNSIKEYQNEV